MTPTERNAVHSLVLAKDKLAKENTELKVILSEVLKTLEIIAGPRVLPRLHKTIAAEARNQALTKFRILSQR